MTLLPEVLEMGKHICRWADLCTFLPELNSKYMYIISIVFAEVPMIMNERNGEQYPLKYLAGGKRLKVAYNTTKKTTAI